MSWLYIFIAGIFEVAWALTIKQCEFKLNIFLVINIVSMTFSVIFLALAVKEIPISIAYSLWTGIGVIGVFLYSVVIEKEAISATSLIFITMILCGTIGLKLAHK